MEIVYREVKSLSDSYIRLIKAIQGKASNLFSFAGLILGISASLSPYITNKTDYEVQFFFFTGVTLIGISAILSLWAYKIKKISIGSEFEDLSNLLSKINEIKKKTILKKVCKDYEKSVEENKQRLSKMADYLNKSFFFMFGGMCLFIISIFVAFVF